MRGLPGSDVRKKNNDGVDHIDHTEELELLIDRAHTCPVCGTKFSLKTLRAGKAFSDGFDLDLRPCYKNIDPIKYHVAMCPVCGFADMSKNFDNILKNETVLLRDNLEKRDEEAVLGEIGRSYSQAFQFYKAAIRCNLIRGAKSSKRGHVALYAAWLLRGWRLSIERDGGFIKDGEQMSEAEENKLLKYALKNFKDAELKERFPINDMTESTYDYLMAALCYGQDELFDAQAYIMRALYNKQLKPGIRRKAEDLRDLIREKKKAQAGS
ncbi:MAG: DUF2225 domain-containing protein [Lachnospiraceae bacterium]|nr:DUF2225 domain-containing protein [Lachnospiraceae bacterium]